MTDTTAQIAGDEVKALRNRLHAARQGHKKLETRHKATRELVCDLVAIMGRVADMLMTDLDQAE